MHKIIIILLISINCYAEVITPIKEVISFNIPKVSLGKELFFDKSFSKDKKIACVSCHNKFGSDDRPVSIGVDSKKGSIQSLSVFNAVNNYRQFWNARAFNLNKQIDGPVHSDFEMGVSTETIENFLNQSSKYKNKFKDVYNKKPSYELFKDAIVAFEETLVTPNSKFDKFLRGEISLSSYEEKGFKLFKDYGCAVCHNGVNVGGNSMQYMGNVVAYPYTEGQGDLYSLTKKENDKNVFRVPPLRNISKTSPYFHDGSVDTLDAAVIAMAYYNLGMVLENDEVDAIVTFLKTLDGDVPATWSNDVK